MIQQYEKQVRKAQQGKERTLKQLKQALRAEIFANTVRLEVAERGALTPDELSHAEQFGILVRQMRHWRGMTEADLARECGLTKQTVNRLELGKHSPRSKTVVRLAEALKVPRRQLNPDFVFARWPAIYQTEVSEKEVVEGEAALGHTEVRV